MTDVAVPITAAGPAAKAVAVVDLGLRACEAYDRPDAAARLAAARRALADPVLHVVVAGEFKPLVEPGRLVPISLFIHAINLARRKICSSGEELHVVLENAAMRHQGFRKSKNRRITAAVLRENVCWLFSDADDV